MGRFKKVEEGMQFGKLKVVSKSDLKKGGHTHWNCLCECGKECTASTGRLNDGRKADCGCVAKERNKHRDLINIKGLKFHYLTVLGKDEEYVGRGFKWKCICDCGNFKSAFGSELRKGDVKSCGCARYKSPVTYIEKENYYIGIDKNNREFYFDKQDYDEVIRYNWYLTDEGYVTASFKGNSKTLHNIILQPPIDLYVDHKNGKPYDNRRSNLRFADKYQNAVNRGIKSTNTSGYTGVSFDKSSGLWRAYIGFRKENIDLGRYKSKEEAVKVRREAEKNYHGEFSSSKSRNLYNT